MTFTKKRFQKLANLLYEDREHNSSKIKEQERQEINKNLRSVGFDGNQYFNSIGKALNIADRVLGKYTLEWGEVNSADNFREPSGQRLIELARSNTEDPFSPEQITNSGLAFHWTKMDKNDYEVIAYIS